MGEGQWVGKKATLVSSQRIDLINQRKRTLLALTYCHRQNADHPDYNKKITKNLEIFSQTFG